MIVLQDLEKGLLSLGFTLAGAAILYLMRARVALRWSRTHYFSFLIKKDVDETLPTLLVNTSSIFIANFGKAPATEIEIVFNYEPANYNIWPVRPFDTHRSPDGRYSLKFANLAPKESFQVELLSAIHQLPAVTTVRSKECVGKEVNTRPTQVFHKSVNVAIVALLLLGVASVVYVFIRIVSAIFPQLIS